MSDNGTLLDNGVTLTGVKAIKFANFVSPAEGGSNKYHEIDIYGTATVPEPSSVALVLVGLLAYAWRRRK